MPHLTCSIRGVRAVVALAGLGALVVTGTATATSSLDAARGVTPRAGAPRGAFHLRLEKSEPAKGAVLTSSPTSIRLWYSLPPERSVTSVKLTNAAGGAVPLGKPHRGSKAEDPVVVDIRQALPPGVYVVSWRTSSRDGHRIAGDFDFSVTAGE